ALQLAYRTHRVDQDESTAFANALLNTHDLEMEILALPKKSQPTNTTTMKKSIFVALGIFLIFLGAAGFMLGFAFTTMGYSFAMFIGLSVLLFFVGLGVGSIVFANLSSPNGFTTHPAGLHPFSKVALSQSKKGQRFLLIRSILYTLTLIVYFWISFQTGAWYITWILFLIAALFEQILQVLFFMGATHD
ncbi:MAG: hypothetical protein ACRDBX_07550, partial [Erysipelotrichaceae bacterium]